MDRKQAEIMVDAIFADLRDRRFLKWLFDAHPENMGPILHRYDGTPILGRESYDSDNPPNFTVTVGSFRRAREAKVEALRILGE